MKGSNVLRHSCWDIYVYKRLFPLPVSALHSFLHFSFRLPDTSLLLTPSRCFPPLHCSPLFFSFLSPPAHTSSSAVFSPSLDQFHYVQPQSRYLCWHGMAIQALPKLTSLSWNEFQRSNGCLCYASNFITVYFPSIGWLPQNIVLLMPSLFFPYIPPPHPVLKFLMRVGEGFLFCGMLCKETECKISVSLWGWFQRGDSYKMSSHSLSVQPHDHLNPRL